MEQKQTFEAAWPELERQLRSALTRRRVPFDAREDVLQETALRLLRSWDRILPESLWAFSLTVALNIVRDDARRRDRREQVVLDDPHIDRDPEHEALVRIELDRVRVALTSMTERQREILLAEVGESSLLGASTPALKMARMRARRRLRSLIEGVSGYASLSGLRLRRWVQEVDVGLANSAASLAVQVAAVVAVSSISVPATFDGELRGRQADGQVARATASSMPPAGSPSELSVAIEGPGRLLLYRAAGPAGDNGRQTRSRRKEELNQHFGVIHKEGDSIYLGGEEQVGPYGASQYVSQVVAGSEFGAGGGVRYDPARCVNRFLQRHHDPCGRPGSARARIKTAVEDKRHDLDIKSGPMG